MSFKLKIITGTCLLLSSTLAFAANYKGDAPHYKGEVCPTCMVPASLMDGFYLGGQVGHDSYAFRQSTSFFDGDDLLTSFNPKLSAKGWMGGIFLGYGSYFNNWGYLGAEVGVNGTNADSSWTVNISDDLGSYSSKVEANHSWFLSILPGVKINDSTLGYIRLGARWDNLKFRESLTAGDLIDDDTLVSRKRTRCGFNYGVGLETLIAGNWSVRTDYNHTSFGSFRSTFGEDTGHTTRIKASDDQFTLGVIYHFA